MRTSRRAAPGARARAREARERGILRPTWLRLPNALICHESVSHPVRADLLFARLLAPGGAVERRKYDIAFEVALDLGEVHHVGERKGVRVQAAAADAEHG